MPCYSCFWRLSVTGVLWLPLSISLSSICRRKSLSLETIQSLDLIANIFHCGFQVLKLLGIKVRVPFRKDQSLGLV